MADLQKQLHDSALFVSFCNHNSNPSKCRHGFLFSISIHCITPSSLSSISIPSRSSCSSLISRLNGLGQHGHCFACLTHRLLSLLLHSINLTRTLQQLSRNSNPQRARAPLRERQPALGRILDLLPDNTPEERLVHQRDGPTPDLIIGQPRPQINSRGEQVLAIRNRQHRRRRHERDIVGRQKGLVRVRLAGRCDLCQKCLHQRGLRGVGAQDEDCV